MNEDLINFINETIEFVYLQKHFHYTLSVMINTIWRYHFEHLFRRRDFAFP